MSGWRCSSPRRRRRRAWRRCLPAPCPLWPPRLTLSARGPCRSNCFTAGSRPWRGCSTPRVPGCCMAAARWARPPCYGRSPGATMTRNRASWYCGSIWNRPASGAPAPRRRCGRSSPRPCRRASWRRRTRPRPRRRRGRGTGWRRWRRGGCCCYWTRRSPFWRRTPRRARPCWAPCSRTWTRTRGSRSSCAAGTRSGA